MEADRLGFPVSWLALAFSGALSRGCCQPGPIPFVCSLWAAAIEPHAHPWGTAPRTLCCQDTVLLSDSYPIKCPIWSTAQQINWPLTSLFRRVLPPTCTLTFDLALFMLN